MEGPGSLGAGAVCLVTGAMLSSTMAAEEESALVQTGPEQHQLIEWNSVVALVVGSLCILALAVYALVACTDCYNSEVSTDCHPASSAHGAAKWGGAGGYSASPTTAAATSSSYSDVNRSILSSGFAGDAVVVTGDDGSRHPLPYALIPAGVPEAQGFRGYAPMEGSSGPPDGYGSTGVQQSSLMGYGGNHGVQQPSVMGYGVNPGVQQPSVMGYGGDPGVQQPSVMGYGGNPGGQGGYGSSGAPQALLAGYGTSAGGQGGYSSAAVPQPSLAGYGSRSQGQSGFGNPGVGGYGGAGEGQAGGGGGQRGGAAQREGWGEGGESSRPLPGAHVPLMMPEPQDPPPPYFASAPYQR